MSTIQVNDAASNFPEALEFFVDLLRRSKRYRAIFDAVYRTNKTRWTVDELAERSGLPRKAASDAARAMANKQLLTQISGGSGTVAVYGKAAFPKNHIVDIRRDLSKPRSLATRATKRRPQVAVTVKSEPRARKGVQRAKPTKCNVLYLTASPPPGQPLRVDAEVAQVQKHVRGSLYRDAVEVHIRPAAGHQTIVDGLNDIRPQIVHFSGHANDKGIALDSGEAEGDSSQFLSYALLREVLEGTSTPPALIVLNACNTSHAKSELLQVCNALISMQKAVGDADAVIFAARFYAAVAAKQPLDKCFQQGVTALKLAGSPDSNIPVLDTSPSAPASSIRLL